MVQNREGWINELHAILPYLCAMMMVVCALLACSSSMLCCTILSEAASSADVACNTVKVAEMRRVRGEVDKVEWCSKSECEKWWIWEGEETVREGEGREERRVTKRRVV
jgi:hypothetical protein